MPIISLHDREAIASFLQRHAAVRLYELGDLDDFFWPSTTWYALTEAGEIRELALAYNAGDLMVLLATGAADPAAAEELLRGVRHLLPRRFYTHLGVGLGRALADDWRAEPHGLYDKMALSDPAQLAALDTAATTRFTPDDQAELEAFYAESYPGNWFDPRMLQTGHYYGYREGGAPSGPIMCVAGVHVYSATQRVAALGNITTRPDARGRGLATLVTARLCRELLRSVDQIGLNVRADNAAAIRCYARLGFTRVGQYEELMFLPR
jgi:ribosomal protein S18 acetylase RimI-like enzyme